MNNLSENSESGSGGRSVCPPDAFGGLVRIIRIGETAVSDSGDCLRTLLGSCVGIAIFDLRQRVGGLAHVMLPSSAGHAGPPGKFVDTAISTLVGEIAQFGTRGQRLQAKLAGGARMLAASGTNSIGDHNVTAARTELRRHGIAVVGAHCGGNQGRRMLFCTRTGSVRVELVGAGQFEF